MTGSPTMALDPGIGGFDYATLDVRGTTYRAGMSGEGTPVLLLHGFPETHYCWHRIAPALAARHTVVVCDIKGYGQSRTEPGGPLGEGFTKREMAAEVVDLMGGLGFERFAVVGHDRGGRVAYRMALDHPGAVDRLVVLNVVPTVEQFERMDPDAALDYWPFFFLAQPPPFAERVVAASAELVVRTIMATWPARPDAIDPAAVERYVEAFTPDAIACICSEYRAAFHLDRAIDDADRRGGRRIACPVRVHWGAEEDAMSSGPLEIWRAWADDVTGGPLPSGHFLAEEAPELVLASLAEFLT
jgi:haloacetate dehalogenase